MSFFPPERQGELWCDNPACLSGPAVRMLPLPTFDADRAREIARDCGWSTSKSHGAIRDLCRRCSEEKNP